ncbi:MAG: 50S ribosomal protein L9 [Kiritimatiellae bacterium]|nr:50S ribosomal protein L9 [Kiritimatiellia bacterium]
MDVILIKAVEGLGGEGDVVRVADGYARNYLIPKGFAEVLTPAARRRAERIRAARAAEQAAREQAARELARRIETTSVTIAARAGEGGKLFGAVTNVQIAEALKLQGIEVDRHLIELEHPIHEIGTWRATVRPAPGVEATLKIWVVAEE